MFTIGTAFLAVASLQACSPGGGPVVQDTPIPTVVAGGDAPTTPGDCIMVTHDVEPTLLEADQAASASSVVIEANYLGPAGPAVWNTPDGRRPTLPEEWTLTPSLSTPAMIGNTEGLRGNLAAPGRVLIPGGTNGCDSDVYSNSALPPLRAGQRYVFFLSPAFDTAKAQLPDANLLRAWSVGADGSARSDTGTAISKAKLTEVLSTHPYVPAGG